MTVATEVVGSARTFLFVPGDQPQRFDRAVASAADLVVVDLEDAVGPDRKEEARRHAVRLLTESRQRVVVRINALGTDFGTDDVAALVAEGEPVTVMVPKASAGAELSRFHDTLPSGSLVLPLVETASGVLDVREVAATPGVARLVLGHLDLAAELGLRPDDHARLTPARFALVVASAAAGLAPPVDGVCTDVRDPAVAEADAARSLRDGFTGKLCIHPAQVAPVHDAFAPDPEELAWAERVLAAVSTDHAVAVVEGQMVDRPVIMRARAVVGRGR